MGHAYGGEARLARSMRSLAIMPTSKNSAKQTSKVEEAVKREIVKKPGPDDLHEQREQDQPRKGVVTREPATETPGPSPKTKRP
jgi:hypothetical protein